MRSILMGLITLAVLSCSQRPMPEQVEQAAFHPIFVGAMAQDTVKADSITLSGKTYKILTGSRGGKYVNRVAKAGHTYKYYIPKG